MRLSRRPERFNHPEWIFELLCDRPNNGILWLPELCGVGDRRAQKQNAGRGPTPHNFP